jgi:ribosomal protein S18 acetylase RimI-like enzyme
LDVYASAREEELSVAPWTDDEKAAFLEFQFNAQDLHYRTYPNAEFLVIEVDGEPIGRLYVNRGPAVLGVMDIALLRDWRGRGIGSQLLNDLLAEAHAAGSIVSLYVERHNPARRLYDRLGFVQVEEGPVYDRLESRPGTAAS